MSSTSGTPATSNVSFTVRRPTPTSRATSTGADSDESSFKVPALPRHLTNGSTPGSPLARSVPASPKRKTATFYSSDEEEELIQDELVTGFDQFGVQRVATEKKKQGPMVIAPLQNRDWREMARRRRAGVSYVPPSGQAGTGADGSVGGLGTRDTINSGPVLQGLQMRAKRTKVEVVESDSMIVEKVEQEEVKVEETEDQRALRALLAGGEAGEEGPVIDIIPSGLDAFGGRRPTEEDAFQQDVDTLPEVATLDDYERVPVSQFGAALLRGMGWKEGQAASKKGRGPVEPWLPQARPALLGIGAKEKEVHDDGSQSKRGNKRPERRYVPVIKKDRDDGERSGSGSGSGTTSRRRSPERDSKSRRSSGSPSRPSKSRRGSPSPARSSRKDREYDKGKDRDRRDKKDYDYDGKRDRRRDDRREYDREDRDRRRDRSPGRSSRGDRDRRDYR